MIILRRVFVICATCVALVAATYVHFEIVQEGVHRKVGRLEADIRQNKLTGATPERVTAFLDAKRFGHSAYSVDPDDIQYETPELPPGTCRIVGGRWPEVARTLTPSLGPITWDVAIYFYFDRTSRVTSHKVDIQWHGL